MCEWGTTVRVDVEIPDEVTDREEGYTKPVGVDACIAPLVHALNSHAGVTTIASCCGHGNRPGSIILADGRELIVAPDFETARKVDDTFPDIHGNERRPTPPESGGEDDA